MVAPNRDLRNVQISTSAFSSTTLQMDRLLASLAMDIDNFDNVRERSPSSSRVTSRSNSVISKISSIPYHKRMEIQNDFSEEELREPINSSQLSYDDQCQESHCVSMVIDPVLPQGSQCVSNEAPALNTSSPPYVDDNDVINIQLLYDPNQPTEPELWDGNFHSISLHRSLEHLSSNTTNLKKSMTCIAKYIQNKKINMFKSNDIKYFEGISKAV